MEQPLGDVGLDDVRRHTARNRVAWNAVAERRRANCPPPRFFVEGGRTLDPEGLEVLGSVAGQRVLDLVCSSGNDALSLAAMGGSVVGVDISDVAIRIATEQAAAAGLDARFVAADLYDLPPDLQDASFDVVHSAAGVICWLPDLAEWGRIVARALKPGGRFLLDEHHPLWERCSLVPDGLRVTGDYFGRTTPVRPEPFDPIRAVHAGAEAVHVDGTLFSWPVGDVVTALAEAGLRIRMVRERPIVEMYAPDPESLTDDERRIAGWVPAAYLVHATKD